MKKALRGAETPRTVFGKDWGNRGKQCGLWGPHQPRAHSLPFLEPHEALLIHLLCYFRGNPPREKEGLVGSWGKKVPISLRPAPLATRDPGTVV